MVSGGGVETEGARRRPFIVREGPGSGCSGDKSRTGSRRAADPLQVRRILCRRSFSGGIMAHLFLSYARADDESGGLDEEHSFVRRLQRDLVARGHHVWLDHLNMPNRGLDFTG